MNIQPSAQAATAAHAPVQGPPSPGARPVGQNPSSDGAAAPQKPAAAPTPEALVSRVEAFAAGIAERLANAAQATPEAQQPGFREATQGFERNLGRVRAGIEDGSLRGKDLASAVQGTLSHLRADLQASRQTVEADGAEIEARVAAARGSEAQAAAERSQGRFQNINAGIAARLEGLASGEDVPTRLDEGIAQAQQAFESATARIETAFFQHGDFDRGTFYGLFSAALGRLQHSVSSLFSAEQKASATLYDANRGVASLSDGLQKVRLDHTV